jgi:hypothetical protein
MQHRRGPDDNRTELCHHWMTEKRLAKWLAEEREIGKTVVVPFNPKVAPQFIKRIEGIAQKARAIGMKVE